MRVSSQAAVFVCLLMSVLFTGCTCKKPYHLADSPPPVPLVPSPDWASKTAAHDTDYFTHPSVAVIEFDEGGHLYRCAGEKVGESCEVNRALDFIGRARKERGTKNVTLVAYVHGWHHDASGESENFRNFQTLIHCLNWGNPANDNQDRRDAYEPMICTGMRPSASTLYIGVYLAWRGESVSRKLGFVKYLSVINRHDAAARVAANEGDDGIEHTVLRLSEAAKPSENPAKFILLGHSFGGLIVNRITTQILEKRLSHPIVRPHEDCDDGSGALVPPFADLVAVINPADSSLRAADLAVRLKWAEARNWLRPCEQRPLNPRLRHPLLVSMHTSSDSATDSIGSFGLKLAFWLDRSYLRKMSEDWKNRSNQDYFLDDPPSPGMLRRNTINHVDYLRNLCYLDQPNRQDLVCLGMADTIRDLKAKAYYRVITDGDPIPQNPKYARDPFYHGAYELLTSVCTEPWEEVPTSDEASNSERALGSWNKEHQFESDFHSRGSCAKPENKKLRELREKLRIELSQSLAAYLAFPVERGQVDDDLLLDVYRRSDTGLLRCGDIQFTTAGEIIQPKPCNKEEHVDRRKGEGPWNDSPVWTLNTSYEILQSHSGFWNTDVLAIVNGIADQFDVVPFDPVYRTLPTEVPIETYPSQGPFEMQRGKHGTRGHLPQRQQQQQQQQQSDSWFDRLFN